MKALRCLLISLIGIFTPLAYAMDWQTCPSTADIKTASIIRTFHDYIDPELWDAFASDIASNLRIWHVAIAGFQARDQADAYKQAVNALSSVGNSVELVSSDAYEKGKFTYTCIYSTATPPHAIIIASTYAVSAAKLNSMAKGLK